MMIAWMSYTVLVSAMLVAGAAAAERACRALGWPTRTVWIAAFALSTGLSARALVTELRRSAEPAVQSATVFATGPAAVRPESSIAAPASNQLSVNARAVLALPSRAVAAIGRAPSLRTDDTIAVALLIASILGATYLALVAARVRRLARALEMRAIGGHHVLVSERFGPALLGVIEPRIVIPRWVLSLSDADQRIILTHEQQHADARDPALLAGATLLLALTPWNPAAWMMFARLRLAIEIDCDQRVLARYGDVSGYGHLLLTVYERTAPTEIALAFVARSSNLERRIRRLTEGSPRKWSARGMATALLALSLAVAACRTEIPTESGRDARGAVHASVVGVFPRCVEPRGGATRFEEMRELARVKHPDLVANIAGRETIIGFVLDEQCTVLHDTVVAFANWQRPGTRSRDVFQAVFGDTSVRRNSGMTFMYSADHKNFLTIAYAVKPSAEWTTRLSRTPCGIGFRFDESCRAEGPVIVRRMDSVRVLVAVRDFHAPNKPVEDLFLITLSHPASALASQSMEHGIIAFQSGALFIDNFLVRVPRLWIGAPTSTGLETSKHLPEVQVFDDIVGVAHYKGLRLTLEQVAQLRPATRCASVPGSCYEVDGQRIEFP